MTNKAKNLYTITFISTRQNKPTTKTATFTGTDENAAKTDFERDAAEMLKHRDISRKFVSIEFLRKNQTYTEHEDYANRYGVQPTQYEFDDRGNG